MTTWVRKTSCPTRHVIQHRLASLFPLCVRNEAGFSHCYSLPSSTALHTCSLLLPNATKFTSEHTTQSPGSIMQNGSKFVTITNKGNSFIKKAAATRSAICCDSNANSDISLLLSYYTPDTSGYTNFLFSFYLCCVIDIHEWCVQRQMQINPDLVWWTCKFSAFTCYGHSSLSKNDNLS